MQTSPNQAREDERGRCTAICEGWIGAFQEREIKYIDARTYAVDAIDDIIELIICGHDPRIQPCGCVLCDQARTAAEGVKADE